MMHNADTYEGQSGAPIFLRRGDTLDLLAVHGGGVSEAGGGPATSNRGARVTIQMLNDLRDWINADAGRTWAEVRNNALVFLPNTAAQGSEYIPDFESGPEDDGTATADIRRIAKVAAKIDDGLRAGEAALPQAQPRGRRELLAFVVSLLRTHFFPERLWHRGYERQGGAGLGACHRRDAGREGGRFALALRTSSSAVDLGQAA